MDKQLRKYLKCIENIDCAYFALSTINEEVERIKFQSDATSYDPDKIKDLTQASILHIKTVIKNKSKIGFDIDADEKLLKQLKSI